MKTMLSLLVAALIAGQVSHAELIKVGRKPGTRDETSVEGMSIFITERTHVKLTGVSVTVSKKLFKSITAVLTVVGDDGSELAIADLATKDTDSDCKISCDLAPSAFANSFIVVNCYSERTRTTYQLPLIRFKPGEPSVENK